MRKPKMTLHGNTNGRVCILYMGHWFHHPNKIIWFLKIHKLSQISKQIPDMFVLIWMHFSWWFQIYSLNSRILNFLNIFWHFWTFSEIIHCRLLTTWKGLVLIIITLPGLYTGRIGSSQKPSKAWRKSCMFSNGWVAIM